VITVFIFAYVTHSQGSALFLLERYSEAETAYLEGLALDPNHTALKDGLQKVRGLGFRVWTPIFGFQY
jgi:hypothetical protein